MTLPSRHRIRNSSPGGLRPSMLSLGVKKKIFCFFETWMPERGTKLRYPTFQEGSFDHCTMAHVKWSGSIYPPPPPQVKWSGNIHPFPLNDWQTKSQLTSTISMANIDQWISYYRYRVPELQASMIATTVLKLCAVHFLRLFSHVLWISVGIKTMVVIYSK